MRGRRHPGTTAMLLAVVVGAIALEAAPADAAVAVAVGPAVTTDDSGIEADTHVQGAQNRAASDLIGLTASSTPAPFKQAIFRQDVPVTIVLVGYDSRDVTAGIRAQLPTSSQPVDRVGLQLGSSRDLGLRFRYRYRIVDAPKGFEDHFFRHLIKSADRVDRTAYQQYYNDQVTNIRNVSGQVLALDGPETVDYLERAAHVRLGVSSTRGYTVFLVNWWGRDDFKFHYYRPRPSPDPDTGFDFNATDENAFISWGGSHGRGWLHDLSAGPEYNTYNFDVDDPDLYGDGVPDYRMPPVWEYVPGGNRAPDTLGADLGLVVRYGAINELFTASPIYDPMNTVPGPGGAERVRFMMVNDDPGSSGSAYLRSTYAVASLRDLVPYVSWRGDVKDMGRIDSDLRKAFRIFTGRSAKPGCWQPFGDVFAELYCYFDANRSRYFPASGRDYVEPVFAFSTTNANMGDDLGLLGYADNDWVTGTQSFAYMWNYQYARDYGVGFTHTAIHEVGHHLGVPHPHDGYDSSTGVDYGPDNEFFYAWVGDATDTVMSYQKTSDEFSVFDKDNVSRVAFAGYENWAQAVISELGGVRLSHAETLAVRTADSLARKAVVQFRSWRYQMAAGSARRAWTIVDEVAMRHGLQVDVPLQTSAARLTGRVGPPPGVDPINQRPVVAAVAIARTTLTR